MVPLFKKILLAVIMRYDLDNTGRISLLQYFSYKIFDLLLNLLSCNKSEIRTLKNAGRFNR